MSNFSEEDVMRHGSTTTVDAGEYLSEQGMRMEKKNISTKSIVRQIDDIVARDIDDEKVMMSVAKGEYFSLDPVGSRVWELIEKPVKVSDLIDVLLVRYEADRETCERDVLTFLEELRDDGILWVEG